MNETMIHAFRSRCEGVAEWVRRDAARRRLLRMGDRALADMNFSRERLEAGVGAWPWRVEDDATEAPAPVGAARAPRSAAPDAAEGPIVDRRRTRPRFGDTPACGPSASDEAAGATRGRLAA